MSVFENMGLKGLNKYIVLTQWSSQKKICSQGLQRFQVCTTSVSWTLHLPNTLNCNIKHWYGLTEFHLCSLPQFCLCIPSSCIQWIESIISILITFTSIWHFSLTLHKRKKGGRGDILVLGFSQWWLFRLWCCTVS